MPPRFGTEGSGQRRLENTNWLLTFMRKSLLILTGIFSLQFHSLAQDPQPAGSLAAKFNPVAAPETSGLLLRKGDRLAICGDSITEQKMYSRIIEDYLTVCLPELKISVRQFGWGGERADGFLARMTNDCLRFKPTIATTCYGMNDHEYRPYVDSIGDAYRKSETAVVESFKANDVRVVLGSPGCVGNRSWWQPGATSEKLNQNLCQLRNIGIEISQQQQVAFADVFWPMISASVLGPQLYGTNYAIPGGDGVHPNWAGHAIMAYAFLKALGVKGDIANFTVDLQTSKMSVSAGHKLLSAKNGEFVIRSSRYAFCSGAPMGLAANWYPTSGYDNITNNDSLRSGLTLVPFDQDLNRFMLSVTNASAKQYRVSWGDQSKTFTGAQLTAGVNLAAEFVLNPFSTRFALIDAAVSAKQDFETRQVKVFFRGFGEKPTMKQISVQTDQVLADTERQHAALDAVIRSAYAPVTYTLKIIAL
jgi:GDSL-like Lipase/Acylhydrolase family